MPWQGTSGANNEDWNSKAETEAQPRSADFMEKSRSAQPQAQGPARVRVAHEPKARYIQSSVREINDQFMVVAGEVAQVSAPNYVPQRN
jgi:hypothetical protein